MASSSVLFANAVTAGRSETGSISRLSRLMLLFIFLFAGLGVTTPASAQTATVTWDSGFVMVHGGPSGFVSNGDLVDVGTTLTFDFNFPTGWTYGSEPSGCNIVHGSGDSWQATITETCHVAGYETPIMVMGVGPTELVEGEFGFFDVMASGGDSPFTVTLESGAVPTGMTFSGGTVSGMPSEEGSFTFTASATNGYGHSGSQTFTLTVVGPSAGAPTIANISPSNGAAEGNTSVVITGTGFTGATGVSFGGDPALSFAANSDTQITAVTPPHAQGPVDVEVVTPGGSVTASDGFTYDAPVELFLSIGDVSVLEGDSGVTTAMFTIQLDQPLPQFRSVTFDIATADGTATGGDDYQISSDTGVSFGSLNAVVSYSIQIYGDTLDEADETFFVNVTNVSGATVVDAQAVGTILNDDASGPTITDVSPSTGAPGTMVTITGAGLTGASGVHFGGVVSADVTAVNDSTVLAEVPAHPGGVVDVEVFAAAGTATAPAAFTVENSPPTANPVSATVAYGSSNNPITLSITGMPASSVDVATAPAHGAANVSGMSITYSPTSGYAGPDTFTYTATNAGGTSSPATVTVTVSPPTIIYMPTNPPAGTVGVLYSQSIASGASGGATPYDYAQVSGTMVPGLTLAADGSLSGSPTTAGTFTFGVVAIDSSTGTGPFSSPPVDVSVTIAPDAPTITGISPYAGPDTGGTTVTITGTNLTGATAVMFGGTPAASFSIDSDTQISAVTPGGPAGAVEVAVTTPGGSATEVVGFTYTSSAIITWDTGAGFVALAFDSGTSIDNGDAVPVGTPFHINIHPSGANTYSSPPSGCGISHAYSDTWAGTVTETCHITIAVEEIEVSPDTLGDGVVGETYSQTVAATGGYTGFFYSSADLPAWLTLDGDTGDLSGTPPALGAVNFTVRATTRDYSLHWTERTYTLAVLPPAPTITGISPDTGPAAGGTTVTITGTNLTGATGANAVTFGGVAATSHTVDSDTQIRAVTAAGSTGAVDVAVATPGGTVTEPDGFTYRAPAPNPYLVTVSDGTYTAGETILFNVYFDDVVVASGNPRLPIDIGGTTRYADYDVHSGVVVRFRYVVQAGDLAPSGIGLGPSILVNGGTIESTDGTAANLTLNGIPDLSGVIVDAVAPTAISSAVSGSPAPDATSALFDVTFSEQVNGVDQSDFVLTTAGSAVGEIAGIGTADGVTYHVNVTGISGMGSLRLDARANGSITDLAGNPMTVPFAAGTPWTRGGSTDVTLSSLAASAGTLDPAFDPATLTYDVAVDNATDSITLTPTATEATATIAVDGQAVASGSASQQIALAVGSTPIAVVVTAEDGTTTQAYTVTVTRAASADAMLAGLMPSAGSLDPAFAPATADYAVAVDNATDSITLTPTATEATATIAVDGQAVASGSASQALALAVGTTAIPVVVTAQDGTTTQTYTVTVTRAASAEATLAGLVPSAGALDPAFDPATTDYAVAVDNGTDSITLTPTATEATATIAVDGQTVASGSASQQIALAVGSTAIQVVVTAADGTTTRAYTATVTRAASSNARLANLVPSVGTLDPAFDAGSFDYAIGVANAVDSIALTPTADDAEAAITVNGESVASGSASQAIALSVGSTAIQVGVIAEDGTTTRTYTVTVERAQPVPTVISRTIEVDAGDTASVDLAEGATGGPFTGAAIVDLSNAAAGTARIERDGQTYQLIFAASATYAGEADLRFTLSNAAGTSAPGTIAFTIVGRPDPAQDPEVVGLLTAQVDAAKRFAQVQTRNFNDRLEQLHDEGDRRTNSMNLRLGYNAEESRGDREIQQLVERAHEKPGVLGYAPHDTGASKSGAFASDEKATSSASGNGGGPDLGPFAAWTGGYVNFGESDDGGLALDHTMVGVSAGIDYRFSKKFIGGFGVGFGRDRTDVGANGTQSTGRAYSAAVYGSYKPLDNFFLDGLIGGSWLDFDSRRFVTANGDFANGTRSGHQLFGSLTAAYEFRDQAWLVSPYGRVEMSRTWLDGFTEEGGGDFGLRYGDQSIDTVSGVIGLRAKYAFKTGWGTLTPGARVEYTHDFAGSSRISMGYIDMERLPYWLDIEASNRSYVTLGLSLDAELPQAWTLGFDYRTAFGNDTQEHAIGLELARRF
ncbi:cadherin-like beta sandwich domain-containing protein [Neoaquamicrobium sediminum]|uniref:cadherin-like beta sandwich domain-containing protein n=1 Tax=Neoaquamicrobium sediminum TaxID=1849104 RepID=UPI00361845ED